MKNGSLGGDCRPLTTFVRTDTNTFREIVQRLTGPSEETDNASASHKPGGGATGSNKFGGTKRPTASASRSSTLLERRQYNRNRQKLQIVKPPTRARSMGSFSAELHSFTPSPALTPTSNFSKLSLAQESTEEPAMLLVLDKKEEEKAIKESRFYLHPSPRSQTRASQPELLDLFPLTSPRQGGTDSGGG
ncbi:VQ motif-containing protein 31 [Punica granatum]|uniref:VQ domain-containing protein n=2 Tax=Punica granatum TaxID=22663 RepID=A0A218W9B2_PUNGR|nr:VQ motif-containing protein 31 [Punica granatum]OWM69444.1 hypothetical protein CDL15_Pgr013905 [Punica granatum]PKI72615.1 hypothetical protein CRG98_006992 [Punica granatum]